MSNGPASDSQRDRDEEDEILNDEDDEEEQLRRRETQEEDDDIHSDTEARRRTWQAERRCWKGCPARQLIAITYPCLPAARVRVCVKTLPRTARVSKP